MKYGRIECSLSSFNHYYVNHRATFSLRLPSGILMVRRNIMRVRVKITINHDDFHMLPNEIDVEMGNRNHEEVAFCSIRTLAHTHRKASV